MLLEALQNFLRIDTRVGIVESGDEAEGDDVVASAVNPCATVFAVGEGPAEGVNDFAGSNASAGNFPEFLHTDTVGLRVLAFLEIEALDELLGAGSTSAFRENHHLGA